MHIIAIAQRKGGVGKTTLAVNLAGELVRRGRSVTLVDADPQASAFDWALPRRLGFVVRNDVPTVAGGVAWVKGIYKSGTDFAIVDSPADLGSVFKLCVEVADLLLLPCGPSSLDLNATKQTVVRAAEIARPLTDGQPPTLLVPTKVDMSVLEGQQIAPELAELGHEVAPHISFDISYVRAFTVGQTISAYAPGSSADLEMRALAEAALRTLGQPVRRPFRAR